MFTETIVVACGTVSFLEQIYFIMPHCTITSISTIQAIVIYVYNSTSRKTDSSAKKLVISLFAMVIQ